MDKTLSSCLARPVRYGISVETVNRSCQGPLGSATSFTLGSGCTRGFGETLGSGGKLADNEGVARGSILEAKFGRGGNDARPVADGVGVPGAGLAVRRILGTLPF